MGIINCLTGIECVRHLKWAWVVGGFPVLTSARGAWGMAELLNEALLTTAGTDK